MPSRPDRRFDRLIRLLLLLTLTPAAAALSACGGDAAGPGDPADNGPPPEPLAIPVLGLGMVAERYTGEVAARDSWAYTSTWGGREQTDLGNLVKVWDVAGDEPVLLDSLVIADAAGVGDVTISDDGRLLMAAFGSPTGGVALYSLDDPANPRLLSRFTSANTGASAHTAKFGRVDGTLHAFLSVIHPDPRIVVLDVSDPTSPRELATIVTGDPFPHDVFVRDGILFVAAWDAGLEIWDIGGGGAGGTVGSPVRLSATPLIQAEGGAHNVWWLHDRQTGSRRYAFVGVERFQGVDRPTRGDIHVIDVSDLTAPREVAFYHVDGAGTHNFWADEDQGVLYAAYYEGGVRALDVRGDLSDCTDQQRDASGRCRLHRTGRELANALTDGAHKFWGVSGVPPHLYASDMLNGIYKLDISDVR